MDAHFYSYRATVKSLYDGDTITVLVDLGFSIHVEQKLRLARIDAPEVKGPTRKRGLAARDWLWAQLPEGCEIQIVTLKDKQEKFGRYLAEVIKDGVVLNDAMVQQGHAVYRTY